MGPPALEPSLIPFLLTLEYYRVIALYVQLSALVALLCDYLATLEREIQFFWGRRWTWGSLFYFMNRYFVAVNLGLGLIAQTAPINRTFCYAYRAHLAGLLIIVQDLWAAAAFTNRVLMILSYRPVFKFLFTVLFIVSHGMALAFSQLNFTNFKVSTHSFFGTPSCTIIGLEPFILDEVYINFLPLLFYHAIVASVGIWAFTREIKYTPYKRSIGVRLLSLMRSQSIAIFAWTLLSMVANSLLFHFSVGIFAIVTPMCLLISSILAARLMIVIKEEAWDGVNTSSIELHISDHGSWPASPQDTEWVFASQESKDCLSFGHA